MWFASTMSRTGEAWSALPTWSEPRPTPRRRRLRRAPALNGRPYMTSPSEPALRGYLERILGWQDVRAVDRALRSVCLGASRQAALVLRGDGDLVPIALALHRRALGEDAPFVVSDPRRGTKSASVRSPANF